MRATSDQTSENHRTRTSRRAMLALGGMLAAGSSALAAVDEVKKSSATAQARLKLAREAMEAIRATIGRGHFTQGERDPLSIWSRRRMEARFELSTTKAERIATAQEHLDEMARIEATVRRMFEAGEVDKLALMDAEYRRLEAQSWLEREKG